MLPSIDEAIKELEIAEKLNPGPWGKHSMNVGLAARNIAEKISGMDPTKAYIVGLMHDIGRRVGIVDIPTHVYEGYKYCMEKGWDEAARICMTHSYLLMQEEFQYEPDREDEKAIKAYIMEFEGRKPGTLLRAGVPRTLAAGHAHLHERRPGDLQFRNGCYWNP